MPTVLAALALLGGVTVPLGAAVAETTVRVFAAGSLKPVFTELAAEYRARSSTTVVFEFGPSGLLRDRLAKGDQADVFASANMEHPRALSDKGLAAPPTRFAPTACAPWRRLR